jgi:O-antigen/teichoic acid export membrane protein
VIREYAKMVVEFIICVPTLMGILLFFFSDQIIIFWFGVKYSSVIYYLKIVAPFTSFFMGYVLTRSVLDGIYQFPYSTFINLCGLIIMMLMFIAAIYYDSFFIFVIGIISAIVVLAGGSHWILLRNQKLEMFSKKNIKIVLWHAGLFLILIVFDIMLSGLPLVYASIVKLIIAGVVSILSFYFYKRIQSGWALEVVKKL